MASTTEEYMLCVAMDIGTTYSSFAYSPRHDQTNIQVKNPAWGASLGAGNAKNPTVVLVDAQNNFVDFGYDARRKFGELQADGASNKKHFVYERFKMKLYEYQVSQPLLQ
jgi:hypothetical protein